MRETYTMIVLQMFDEDEYEIASVIEYPFFYIRMKNVS